MNGVSAWLRSTSQGTCHQVAASEKMRGVRDELGALCETGDEGTWLLPGHILTWPEMAAHCVALCQRCKRCQYISMSAGFDKCRWHATCSLTKLVATDSITSLPERPSSYRTGARPASGSWTTTPALLSGEEVALRPASGSWAAPSLLSGGEVTSVATTWIRSARAPVGTCGRAAWNMLGDCHGGSEGSFNVNLGVDTRSAEDLAMACFTQCARCPRCATGALSISSSYGACSWYDACRAETKHRYTHKGVLENKRGYLFRGTV